MTNKTKAILGVCLILVGFFWDSIKNNIPDISIPSVPSLDIPKPDDNTLETVSSIANLVTDKDDRLRLAIFNMVFSERINGWECDSQQVNDTYVAAAGNEFGISMAGKYDGYAGSIEELFKDSLGVKISSVSEEQKESLSNDFSGLAYALAN
jgi:hypothetical protein